MSKTVTGSRPAPGYFRRVRWTVFLPASHGERWKPGAKGGISTRSAKKVDRPHFGEERHREMNALHRVLDPQRDDRVPPGFTALAVMTKAPQAGRVKTRLTPPLSPEEAAALNTCFLQDTAAAISRVSAGERAQGVAVYTPRGSEAAYSEILPEDFILVPQH